MKIVLIVGHNKKDQGAFNKTYNVTEYEYNTKLVNDIVTKLNIISPDIETKILLRDDIAYTLLPRKINDINPDLSISFHCNAYDQKVNGTEFLYWVGSKLSHNIATILNNSFKKLGLFKLRGLKSVGGNSKQIRGRYLLAHTKTPCIIAETFFIDNNIDFLKAKQFHGEIIETYCNAIVEIKKLFNVKIETQKSMKYRKLVDTIMLELKLDIENALINTANDIYKKFEIQYRKLMDIINKIEEE